MVVGRGRDYKVMVTGVCVMKGVIGVSRLWIFETPGQLRLGIQTLEAVEVYYLYLYMVMKERIK